MGKEYSKRIKKTVEQLNVIDDALFRKMAEDEGFCEEVISTIIGEEIKVLIVTEQKDIKNLQGRSVILDALCEDASGRKFNVEVQKDDNDDHQRRVRYNASLITANITETGTHFRDVPDVVIIFIARFDVFGNRNSVYHIDRIVRETGEVVNNGLDEIYVNAAARDGSDVSLLMDIFTRSEAYDFTRFPKTSARKHQFKESEKGDSEMSGVVEEFAKWYAEECVMETKIEDIENCSKSFNVSIEEACKALGVSYADYSNAKKLLEKGELA